MPPLNLDLNFTKTSTSGPAISGTSGTSGMFDASGWAVNFSGTQTATSTSGQRATTPTNPLESVASAAGGNVMWIALGVVVLAVLYKKLG